MAVDGCWHSACCGWVVSGGDCLILQVIKHDFLNGEGEARSVRTHEIYANRGNIYDRNGEPLAISAPVYTIHANPRVMDATAEEVESLAWASISQMPNWIN